LRTSFDKHSPRDLYLSSKRRRFLSEMLCLGSAVTLGILGCGPNKTPGQLGSGKLKTVATTGMIADLVLGIGGDHVELTQLIGAGVDPHLYKPIRDDIVQVLGSDLVFYNGLFLEGRMAELFARTSKANRNVLALADAIPVEKYMIEPGTDGTDPHIWMDVSMWWIATHSVEKALTIELPEHAKEFQSRGDSIRKKLDALDRRGLEALSSIPSGQRVLVTSHDAFQYFGRRYGIEVQGIQGMSTASEAGLQRIPELLDLIIARSVKAVFRESSVAGKLIEALVEGAAARGYKLKVGEELYSDALGPRGSGADSYIGMMEHNFREISTALGGEWNH
jgi:manganese/zinc/iron transport system substrate-binding protein